MSAGDYIAPFAMYAIEARKPRFQLLPSPSIPAHSIPLAIAHMPNSGVYAPAPTNIVIPGSFRKGARNVALGGAGRTSKTCGCGQENSGMRSIAELCSAPSRPGSAPSRPKSRRPRRRLGWERTRGSTWNRDITVLSAKVLATEALSAHPIRLAAVTGERSRHEDRNHRSRQYR